MRGIVKKSSRVDVPFVDLRAQYDAIKAEIDPAIQAVIERSAFSGGPFVKTFEEHFADAHGAAHGVGVDSGTSALHVALWALGVGPTDEVIVPTNSFLATAEAVRLCGATPVFADCEEKYYGIDPDDIRRKVTPRTKAVIAVHLYGQAAQMASIASVADAHGLLLVEDCAQAHLAEMDGRRVGTFGVCGCFSFYPGKNLGAYGEAGAVLTNDGDLAREMRALRDHGSLKKYYHHRWGHNYRMDGIQGAVLDVKLRHLHAWTDARRANAAHYRRQLASIEEVVVPQERPGARHVYHLFVVRAPRRDALMAFLSESGIATGIHYPVPCHMQEAVRNTSPTTPSCPVAERLAGDIVSLPMYPELTVEQIEYVCDRVGAFYANGD